MLVLKFLSSTNVLFLLLFIEREREVNNPQLRNASGQLKIHVEAVWNDLKAVEREGTKVWQQTREKFLLPLSTKPKKNTAKLFSYFQKCEFYLQYFIRQKNYICMQRVGGRKRSPNKRRNDRAQKKGKREKSTHRKSCSNMTAVNKKLKSFSVLSHFFLLLWAPGKLLKLLLLLLFLFCIKSFI